MVLQDLQDTLWAWLGRHEISRLFEAWRGIRHGHPQLAQLQHGQVIFPIAEADQIAGRIAAQLQHAFQPGAFGRPWRQDH